MKICKQIIALLTLLMVAAMATPCTAQQYTTKQNIAYYADSISSRNEYINSRCKLDIYYPSNTKDFATVVWFHGGGLTGGEKELPKALMEKGVAIVGVNYRLAPQVAAPAFIEDAAAAVAWVFKNIEGYGGSTKKIIVSGHSAGGYLGLMLTLDKKYLAKHAVDADSIAGLIPFSGQAVTHFTVRKAQGIPETQATIDTYAPLYHVRANAPPTVLITGDRELELYGRYEENAYLWRMMKLVGHKNTKLLEMAGYDHGGMPYPAFPILLKEVSAMLKNK